MNSTSVKIMRQREIDRGIERCSIEIEYKTEWAKDEEGIARSVGEPYEVYKDKDTGEVIFPREKIKFL